MDHRMLAAARGGICPCLRYVNRQGSTLVHGFRPGLRFRVKRLRVLGWFGRVHIPTYYTKTSDECVAMLRFPIHNCKNDVPISYAVLHSSTAC